MWTCKKRGNDGVRPGLKNPDISMNAGVQTLGPSIFEIYFTYSFPTGFRA